LIPTAGWDSAVSDIVLLTFANKAKEQGVWASKTAIDILKGKDISKVDIVKNKKATIYVNATLSKKLNIIFPFDLIDNAVITQ
jgi:ABC-type uncharacterized transport system substrate-binding protein